MRVRKSLNYREFIMKIVREALAGTQESSDLMVKIAPAHGELEIVIHSEVIKQFGEHIRGGQRHIARHERAPWINHY